MLMPEHQYITPLLAHTVTPLQHTLYTLLPFYTVLHVLFFCVTPDCHNGTEIDSILSQT